MKEKKEKAKLSEILGILDDLLRRDEERQADYEEKLKGFRLKEQEDALLKEEAEVQKTYPEFSLEKELENKIFKILMESGVDMKTAYEAANLQMLKAKKEKAAEKKKRPVENGSLGGDSAIFKSGVYAMSKKDRQDLAKRVQRGETIRL